MKKNRLRAEVSPRVGVWEEEINKAAVVPQNLKPATEVGELSFTHFGETPPVLKLYKWQMLETAKVSKPIQIKQFKQCKIIILITFSNSNMKRKMMIKQKNQVASAYGKSLF